MATLGKGNGVEKYGGKREEYLYLFHIYLLIILYILCFYTFMCNSHIYYQVEQVFFSLVKHFKNVPGDHIFVAKMGHGKMVSKKNAV